MENPEIHLIYDTSYPGCLEKTVLSFIFGTCVTSFKKNTQIKIGSRTDSTSSTTAVHYVHHLWLTWSLVEYVLAWTPHYCWEFWATINAWLEKGSPKDHKTITWNVVLFMFLQIFSHIFHCLKKGNTSDIPHCKGFVASFLFYKRHDNRVVVVSALVHYESTRSTRFFFPLKNIFSRDCFHIPKTKTKNSNALLTTPS